MGELKRILLVDDSEIDREVLKSILEDEFELIEADNGDSALDIILEKKEVVDAVMLDVSMPVLDGLSTLRILREKSSEAVSVFMITAEATKDNVEEAAQYNIAEFIRKPFDRADVLNRVRTKLGVEPKKSLTIADIEETKNYINDLKYIYDRCLRLSNKDNGRDERREEFMRILLHKHYAAKGETEIDSFEIEMLCKAAYLCNIGELFLPNTPQSEKAENAEGSAVSAIAYDSRYKKHTVFGADMVQLNTSRHCRHFVKLCADICLNHHERYDGSGFPNGRCGNNISVYAQMCGLLEKFDDMFFNYSKHNEIQFDYVINQLNSDIGLVSQEVMLLLEDSRYDIIRYYNKNYI